MLPSFPLHGFLLSSSRLTPSFNSALPCFRVSVFLSGDDSIDDGDASIDNGDGSVDEGR
jgi:hypothetical protein